MEKNEVFLGQKKSIARYDLDQQKPTWSLEIEETPSIMTTYNNYLFAQCLNKWGTKYVHYMIDAIEGDILWRSEELKSYVLPHYLDEHMFYTNISGQICKLELKTGKVIFEEKFAGVFTRSSFILFLTDSKVYLTSKKQTLLVNQANGATSVVSQLSNFTTSKITVASGVGRDQISTVVFSAMSPTNDGFVGGDGGMGGGDGG